MANSGADLGANSGDLTANLRLAVGDMRIVHPITVPNAAVPAAEIVPALQGLVSAVVASAEAGQIDLMPQRLRRLLPATRADLAHRGRGVARPHRNDARTAA